MDDRNTAKQISVLSPKLPSAKSPLLSSAREI